MRRYRLYTDGHGSAFYGNHYAQLPFDERQRWQLEVCATLRGMSSEVPKRIIFVNDVNVSGSQENMIRKFFTSVGVAEVLWLYLIDAFGVVLTEPQEFETRLNEVGLEGSRGFVEMMSDERNSMPTTKLVFSLSKLDSATQKKIVMQANEELVRRIEYFLKVDNSFQRPEFDRLKTSIRDAIGDERYSPHR
jgi:hypothetical protein